MSQRTALITGGSGFIGSHLAMRLVRDGWDLHLIVTPHSSPDQLREIEDSVRFHVHDGSSTGMLEIFTRVKPAIVFHLASLFLSEHTVEQLEPLIRSNILFGTQLLEVMAANGVRLLVNTGTSWQHYENKPYSPVNLYAATKQAFEDILEYYVEAKGLQVITLKLFDTYGPNDPRPKLFHLLNKTAASGEPLNMSAGEQLIDLVHVDDVVEAFQIATQRLIEGKVSTHENYAVSSGNPLPLKELVQLYADVTKQTVPVNWGARPYRNREVMVPWNSGMAIDGWSPKICLAEGLRGVAKQPC